MYYVRVSDANRGFLEELKRKLADIGAKPYIYRIGRKNCYTLEIRGIKYYNEIRKRIEKNLHTPSIPFVRGFIDAEGSLQMDEKRNTVKIYIVNKNKNYLNIIGKLLEKQKIRYKIAEYDKKQPKYRLMIFGWKNVKKLLSTIKPIHPKFKKMKTQ